MCVNKSCRQKVLARYVCARACGRKVSRRMMSEGDKRRLVRLLLRGGELVGPGWVEKGEDLRDGNRGTEPFGVGGPLGR